MRETAKKLKIAYNAVYYSLHRTAQTDSKQNRKRSGRPRCTTEQEEKYIRVSSLRNRHLTIPQLVASLNTSLNVNSEDDSWILVCWFIAKQSKQTQQCMNEIASNTLSYTVDSVTVSHLASQNTHCKMCVIGGSTRL